MRSIIFSILFFYLSANGTLAQDSITNDKNIIGTIIIDESVRGVETIGVEPKTIVNIGEIESRQASTLGQIMDTIPNVKLVNGITPQGAGIQVRGLGSQPALYGMDGKVTVALDGVTSGAEEVYRNGSLLSMEPELFSRLKITRGPSKGFNFQGGAVGGTVELKTKNGSSFVKPGETFAFRQKLGIESLGNAWSSTSLVAFAPNPDVDALLFFGRRKSEDRKDGDGFILQDTAFDQSAYMAKFNYFINDSSKLTFSHIYNSVPEKDTPYDVYLPSVGAIFGNVDRLTKDQTTYLEYNLNPNDNDKLDITLRISQKKEELSMDAVSAGANSLLEADHITTTNSLRLENKSEIFTGSIKHNLMLGVEYASRNRSSVDTSGGNNSSAPGGTDTSTSFYAINDIEIGGSLIFSPQLRSEQQTLKSKNNQTATTFGPFGPVVSPAVQDGREFSLSSNTGALGLEYKITDDLSTFTSVAYNENLPLLDDLRGLDDGTLENKSEKSRTQELGLSYDTQSIFGKLDSIQARMSFYKNQIWDVHTYSNINKIDLEGAELELSYVNGNSFFELNSASSRGTINGTSDPFNYATGDSHQVSFGRSIFNNQLSTVLEIYHAPSFDRTSENTGALAPSKAYTLSNLRVTYLPNSGVLEGIEIRASVENMANLSYRAFGNERNGPGRNIKLTIAKTF